MIILFQNTVFLKEFFACNGYFGLFTKIKKGCATSFWCIFSAWSFHNSVLYLIPCQWTKFQCHIFFPFQDIKQNAFLSSNLGSWWRHKTLRFIFEQPLKQWLTGRKRGEDGNTKIWISRERKKLFRWSKKHFS